MTEKKYRAYGIVDGKFRQITVDEDGKITNKNPSKDELENLEKEPYQGNYKGGSNLIYTDDDLLYYLRQFYKENGRPPAKDDFKNDCRYPGCTTYIRRFGSWSNALKLVGLDVDSMVEKGALVTKKQKARLAEVKVINHFRQRPIDLAGENQNSPCDGICPNGNTYDVKSSKLHKRKFYAFGTKNKYKEEIEIYYFVALDDKGNISYVWRIPREIIKGETFYVGITNGYEFNVENMIEYDITDRFK